MLLALMVYSENGGVSFCYSLVYVLSGGLRLKRDITEYGEYVRSFNAPSVDEKFELLGM